MKVLVTILMVIAAGTVAFGTVVLVFLIAEPSWQMTTPFAPGFALKSFLERGGAEYTNRIAVAATLYFWWFLAALVIVPLRHRRRAA